MLTQYQALALVNARTRSNIRLRPFECLTNYQITDERMVLVQKVVKFVDLPRRERVTKVGYRLYTWTKHGPFWQAAEPITVWTDEKTDHMK